MRDKLLDSINTKQSRTNAVALIALLMFLAGMIVGSAAHDSMFHAIEQSIEKARQ